MIYSGVKYHKSLVSYLVQPCNEKFFLEICFRIDAQVDISLNTCENWFLQLIIEPSILQQHHFIKGYPSGVLSYHLSTSCLSRYFCW